MENRHLIFSLLSLFLATVFLSCSDLEREKDMLEVDRTSILIDQEGGQDHINVEANAEWTIQEIPAWLSVDPASGELYNVVTVTAKENKESDRRKASLVFVRGKLSKTVEVEQLGTKDLLPFLTLSEELMSVLPAGGMKKIKLTTNRPWKVEFVPNWISVTPSSGEKSAEITIQVTKENREPKQRNTIVVFTNGYVKQVIDVYQFGLSDISMMPDLPIFPFKEFSYNQETGHVLTHSLFINSQIKDKIYLGNLIDHTTESNTHIPEFTGYTFNPITVSTSAPVGGEVVKNYIPSLAEQNAFAGRIIEQLHNPDDMLAVKDNAVEFYTHKELRTIGAVNLGVKLDEVVSGSSYTEKEMSRKYGVIYSFKHALFTLDMDQPQKLIKEELKEADKAKGVSYVASVTYGRVGLLVVESDIDSRDVRMAINKVLNGEALSPQEETLLMAADISYVYFDKDKNAQALKGTLDAVNAYRDAIFKETDLIYPVEFSLANYEDHSPVTLSYSFVAGE